MQVTIKGDPKEILVYTISLQNNKAGDDNTTLIRCHLCATQLIQVRGKVARIYPGLEPSSDTPTILRCHKCNFNYTFKNSRSNKDVLSLTLAHTLNYRDFSTFHCINCPTQLLRYNNQYVKVLPTLEEVEIPYRFSCLSIECNRNNNIKYNLIDLL